MGLNMKDIAGEILNDGWDPKKDEVTTGFENLEDGLYDVILMGVQWKGPNDNGTEWLSFEFEVQNEGFEGKKHFAPIFFSSEKMMKVNIQKTMKTGAVLDVDVDVEDFEDEQTLVSKLEEGIGTSCMLELETKKTKKGNFTEWTIMEEAPF